MTWSAANEPMITSGSRFTRMAAARPIAARGLLGFALEHHVRVGELRQLELHGGAVRATGDHHDPIRAGQRHEPVPGGAQQRLAAAGEIVKKLRRVRAGQRPQSRTDAPAGMTL